jgi:cytochrome c-type biogenesis protein
MLPAYFATGFGRRTGIAAATGVYAAGVATLIVPIGLGASALSAALPAHHLLIFSIGGAAMLAGGAAVLAGWKPMLPMPSLRSPSGHGYGAAYGLAWFSGIASACCAPVLAGAVVLTGSALSFGAALAVSLTYVAGMVAPLAVLALVRGIRSRTFRSTLPSSVRTASARSCRSPATRSARSPRRPVTWA